MSQKDRPGDPGDSSGRPVAWPAWDDDEDATLSTRIAEAAPVPVPSRRRDRATLTVVLGPETGRVFSLEDATVIGRGKDCSIRLDDGSVSRNHVRITRHANARFVIEDLNSRNGTFVDGYRIKRHELQDGNRIQLGPSIHLRFAITDDDEEHLLRRLYESSVRDPLTGAFNRKHFNERLASEVAYAIRHKTELALLMFDLDHFKAVNDDYGHLAGDKVLRSVGGLVSRTIRVEDIFCRYGGEEFTVIARGIDGKGAMALAERIRSIIETARIVHEEQWIPISVSFGVSTLACCENGNAERLIGIADQRLYEAKLQGRNRVVGPRP